MNKNECCEFCVWCECKIVAHQLLHHCCKPNCDCHTPPSKDVINRPLSECHNVPLVLSVSTRWGRRIICSQCGKVPPNAKGTPASKDVEFDDIGTIIDRNLDTHTDGFEKGKRELLEQLEKEGTKKAYAGYYQGDRPRSHIEGTLMARFITLDDFLAILTSHREKNK